MLGVIFHVTCIKVKHGDGWGIWHIILEKKSYLYRINTAICERFFEILSSSVLVGLFSQAERRLASTPTTTTTPTPTPTQAPGVAKRGVGLMWDSWQHDQQRETGNT